MSSHRSLSRARDWHRAACALSWVLLTGPAPLLSACTAGQYEIADCAVSAQTLLSDTCRELNADPSACLLYQCNTGTGRCELRARDFDRDGDPDSACNGSDCDDNNAQINGMGGGKCACSPASLALTCAKGVGACRREAQYVCKNNQLSCPAMAAAPQDWGNTADPVSKSWDRDCDEQITSACCYTNSNSSKLCVSCDVIACGSAIATAIGSNDASTACSEYCKPKDRDSCPQPGAPQFLRCSPDCGSSLAICYCQWEPGLLGIGGSCKPQPNMAGFIDRVNCR
jgi:hypothetical protein